MKNKTSLRAAGSAARKLIPFLAPYKRGMALAVFCIICATGLQVAAPKIEGLITTRLFRDAQGMLEGTIAGVSFDYIARVLAVLVCIYVLGAVVSYLYNFILARVIQNAMRDLRGAVENKIRRLPVSYFDGHTVGDILSRITNDVDAIANALQQSFAQVLNAVLVVVLALTMSYLISWQLSILVTLLVPASILVSRFIVKKSQILFNQQQNALGALNGTVQELYTGFNEIKLYGQESRAQEQFNQANEALCVHGFKAQFVSGLMNPLVSLITYVVIAVVAVFGGLLALSGGLALGDLQASIRYVWQINQPLSQVTQLSSALQAAFAALTRVAEILDEEEEIPDPVPGKRPDPFRGSVRFEHVRFDYESGQPLIKDLNAQVESGQMVAIVGPTGAGKTTLINLLMRFYDVQGGAIKIDGVDIREMRREDLRGLLGMVLQDTWLFQGTIHENIAYGRQDANRVEVVQAAKAANVHHFIRTLTDGYDMVLNEEASNISQGEKQLLTIARAILADPPILILDEATSSVDTRLEVMLQKAMQRVMQGRTSFVIAHRLSTIRNADLILVINQGDIVEQGTHETLMAQGGFYAKLYNAQFREE